jgi:hypothetical protein
MDFGFCYGILMGIAFSVMPLPEGIEQVGRAT